MAVKRIRSTVDEKEQKQLLMDLEVVMKSSDCPFIVTFYGAIFQEGKKKLHSYLGQTDVQGNLYTLRVCGPILLASLGP